MSNELRASGTRSARQRDLLQASLLLLALLAINTVLHRTIFTIGLIADDYSFLLLDSKNVFAQTWGVFRPAGFGLFMAIRWLVGDNQVPYAVHLYALLLHAINCYFMFRITEAVTKRRWLGVAVAVLGLTSPFAVEPMFWLSASVFYLPMTTVILVVLLKTIHYATKGDIRPESTWRFSTGIAIATSFALAFHEISLSLPVIALLVMCSVGSWRRPIAEWRRILIPTTCVVITYAILRLFQGPSTLVGLTPELRAGNLVYSVWSSFIPTGHLIWSVVSIVRGQPALIAWLFAFGVLGCVGLLLALFPAIRPAVYWFLAVIVAALPPVLFSTVGGRYLYLPAILGCLTTGFIMCLLLKPHSTLLSAHGRSAMAFSSIIILLGLLLALNLRWMEREAAKYMDASRLADSLGEQAIAILSDDLRCSPRQTTYVMLVDFPAGTLTDDTVSYLAQKNGLLSSSGEFRVTTAYCREKQRFDGRRVFSSSDEIVESADSQQVLVYCSADRKVYLADGKVGVPCLGRGVQCAND